MREIKFRVWSKDHEKYITKNGKVIKNLTAPLFEPMFNFEVDCISIGGLVLFLLFMGLVAIFSIPATVIAILRS